MVQEDLKRLLQNRELQMRLWVLNSSVERLMKGIPRIVSLLVLLAQLMQNYQQARA